MEATAVCPLITLPSLFTFSFDFRMSPPSFHVVADTSVERDACLAQLKLLNARPELLSRPEYAHVVLWVQRVAALVRPADPTLSGKQAAVPSRIPAPPTRRTIAFPTTTGPSASPRAATRVRRRGRPCN